MADLDLVTVAEYSLRHEAEIARARLASHGIPALVQADDEGGLNPGFFAEYGVRLVVRSDHHAVAAALLAEAGVSDPGGIHLDPQHVEAFFAHAVFISPEEACGLIAFEEPGYARFVYCLTNADRSEHRFTVDPTEHFHALVHAERHGWEIAGSFHSHPTGAARPSATDVEAAGASAWIHVIVGLGGESAPDLRAYTMAEGEVAELQIVVS